MVTLDGVGRGRLQGDNEGGLIAHIRSFGAFLRDKGLLSEYAFAALVTLAVFSTLLTGPLFRWILGYGAERRQSGRQPA